MSVPGVYKTLQFLRFLFPIARGRLNHVAGAGFFFLDVGKGFLYFQKASAAELILLGEGFIEDPAVMVLAAESLRK